VTAAQAAGLPVIESTDPSTDLDALVVHGGSMRFPMFVMAVAGGGGRGMRRVDDPGELAGAVESASREASSSFGDAAVYLEQAVVAPRHIEVQVLADEQGGAVHLFGRGCSLQRRRQRVSEQARAPAPGPPRRQPRCAAP